jgi:ATP-dependent DNA helicase RecG
MTTAAPDLADLAPARLEQLAKLGVNSPTDLLEYFPRDYVQESPERDISALKRNEIQLARGEVIAVDFVHSTRPRFVATIFDGTGKLNLTFFNGGYLRGKIVPGKIIRVRGKLQFFSGPQMINPKWEFIAPDAPKFTESVYRPIYSATADLPSPIISRMIRQRLPALLESVHEWFQPKLLKKRRMVGRAAAYQAIHHPASKSAALAARKRLVYDELMLLQLGLCLSRRLRDAPLAAPEINLDVRLDDRIRRRLAFKLTGAQDRAVADIVRDFTAGRPMNRLLQGDVGSGKTAVAVYAMLAAAARGYQSAILAPTEVLAEQHYLTLTNMLAGSRLKIGLFTQRTVQLSRGSLKSELSKGDIHLSVGTQALIQQDVEFANLGLVVVDEQHRLGVLQRASLRDKARSPHYLVMTATPIPRTLALSYMSDFDVSVLDELPPGRQPIKTRWHRMDAAAEAFEFVREEVAAARQAYIVLPKVDDDGFDEVKSVLREAAHLARGPLAGLRLASLHGRMSTEEKQSVMLAFRERRIDVLVATTVIEVGIDVPNASVIVIEQAERFGLAQLHQLRGRVGRGTAESHCILLSDAQGEEAQARLKTLVQSQNGFEIAEMDLKLRGPGEFFGSRQHGLPHFKLADLSKELELLVKARDDAQALLRDDPNLAAPQHRHLRGALIKQFGQTLGLALVG